MEAGHPSPTQRGGLRCGRAARCSSCPPVDPASFTDPTRSVSVAARRASCTNASEASGPSTDPTRSVPLRPMSCWCNEDLSPGPSPGPNAVGLVAARRPRTSPCACYALNETDAVGLRAARAGPSTSPWARVRPSPTQRVGLRLRRRAAPWSSNTHRVRPSPDPTPVGSGGPGLSVGHDGGTEPSPDQRGRSLRCGPDMDEDRRSTQPPFTDPRGRFSVLRLVDTGMDNGAIRTGLHRPNAVGLRWRRNSCHHHRLG